MAALSDLHQLDKLRQISADGKPLILIELYIAISDFIRQSGPIQSVDSWHENRSIQPAVQVRTEVITPCFQECPFAQDFAFGSVGKTFIARQQLADLGQVLAVQFAVAVELLQYPPIAAVIDQEEGFDLPVLRRKRFALSQLVFNRPE